MLAERKFTIVTVSPDKPLPLDPDAEGVTVDDKGKKLVWKLDKLQKRK